MENNKHTTHNHMENHDHSKMDHSMHDHATELKHTEIKDMPVDHSMHDQSKKKHKKNNHDSTQHGGEHHDHHAMMVDDFKKRFFISLILTLPILLLSPMIQMFMNVDWRFTGDTYVLFGLSTILFFYGGKPFLVGALDEFKRKSPAMMMLIALAITVAYIYSTLTVFVLVGNDFFWELATLISIMLLGHWIEMKSVLGASKALEELIKLMPDVAHMIHDDGEVMDHPVGHFEVGFKVLVKPGEKIPLDGVIYEGIS